MDNDRTHLLLSELESNHKIEGFGLSPKEENEISLSHMRIVRDMFSDSPLVSLYHTLPFI
jgi:hypothetical protein